MRGVARKPATDDPEPAGRDLAAEAAVLIRGDARLRAENERLLGLLTTAAEGSPRQCAEIDRLCSELVVVGIRLAESARGLGEVAGALRDDAASRFADDCKFDAGVELGRELAARTMVPRQRRSRPRHAASGQDPLPFPRLVQGITLPAALGAAFRASRTWAWLTSAHHAVLASAAAGGLAAGTALVVAAGMAGPSAHPAVHVAAQALAPNPAASVWAAAPMEPALPVSVLVRPRRAGARLDVASMAPVPSPASASPDSAGSSQPLEQPASSSPPDPPAPPVTVPAARGQLEVSAPSLDLGAPQAGQLAVTGQFTVTNTGGSYARWRVSASSSPDAVTLTDADGNPVTHGWLAPGQSVTVTVSVALAAADPGGSVTVTVRGPGGGTVAVTWEAMLAAVVPVSQPTPLPSVSVPG